MILKISGGTMVVRQREQQLNNAGFSLVELIVSILITGFICGMIVAFISISRRTYSNINTEAVLQTEASIASNYVNELLLEAQACNQGTFSYIGDDGASHDAKVLWIKAPDNSSADRNRACDYFILLEKDTGILRFCRKIAVASTPESMSNPSVLYGICQDMLNDRYALLAEHVTSIDIIPNLTDGVPGVGTLVEFKLSLDYAGKAYNTTLYVAARNLQ